MSAHGFTTYRLFCNGSGRGSEYQPCGRGFRAPDDLDHNPRPAELRKLAAKEGWTHVRSDLGRRFDRDFCPEHKPAPKEG